MRNTWTHLMVSDTFYFIVDDTVFCPKDDKPYCPLTPFLFKLDFVRLIFSIFFHIKYYSPCLFDLKICIIYIYLNY